MNFMGQRRTSITKVHWLFSEAFRKILSKGNFDSERRNWENKNCSFTNKIKASVLINVSKVRKFKRFFFFFLNWLLSELILNVFYSFFYVENSLCCSEVAEIEKLKDFYTKTV